MKRLPYLLTLIIFIMQACGSDIKNSDQIALEQVDSLFKSLYPENEPGAEVLILKGDSVIFEKGYGLADMDSLTPIDENTFFNIASVSKQFSGVAVMMLAEEGKLSLDDSVKKWFPNFKADFFNKIKIRHLLSHTSGIPDSRNRSDRMFVTTATDVESYSYMESLEKLNFKPGSSYEYMNPTFQLMYTIIERASGIPFDQFMRERIFLPAGMNESTYFEADKFIPRMAHGYLYDSLTRKFNEFDYGEESFFATKADGGLYTSVKEFVQWEKALRTNKLISEASKKEAHTPKINILETPFTSYGYGWFIEEKPKFPVKIYHTGDNGGFQIYAGRYPQQEILYLIFSNRNDRDRELSVSKLDNIFKKAGWLK
ncbi:MAG: serine hydrolase domain-containing protein [Rikenellaceae bacterium]